MRVLLVSANTESINMPTIPLGLGLVTAAVQQAGHRVEMLDLMNAGDVHGPVREAIKRLRPQIIGISVRNIDDQCREAPRFLLDQVKEVIAFCRGMSTASILLGGAGYSIFPQSALDYLGADMGIQGEGETAFPALLACLEGKGDPAEVPGLYLKGRGSRCERMFHREVDSIELPDAQLWGLSVPKASEIWMPVQTRRGCPMNCSYCSTSAIEGRRIRRRDPQRMADWIARHAEAGFARFYFTDNTFNMPASYAREICRALIDRALGISWRCILYPGRVDPAMAGEMARAGCKEVALGFESGSERILRAMNKKFGPEDVRQNARMLADQGIGCMGFLLLGGPGETRASVEESLRFADSLNLEALKVTRGIRIYPGTALARTAVQNSMIAPDDDLLFPRFYLERGLEGWLDETVMAWAADRPWIYC